MKFRCGWHPSVAVTLLIVAWGFFPGPSVVHAQSDTGSLRVAVTDASGAAIVGALVKVTNEATNVSISKQTVSDGYATFDPIQRGNYEVEVSMSGFKGIKTTGVIVQVNGRRFLSVAMTVAPVTEAVDVVAAIPPLQTEQASLGQVVNGDVAVQLPLQARRYTDLALLVPGVTVASDLNPVTRGPDWFVANGNYQTQNNFLLDGFDNNQGTTNAQSLSSEVVRPSPDAISEFKVETNSYSAEFGRSAGAVVNVALKSGTNQIHGSAFYYNRNQALAANSWLNNLTGIPKQDLGWHQFGGSIGGPIVKNKLFYFGDYEGFHRNFSDTYLRNVPTLQEKQGIFPFVITDPQTGNPFPNNTIPQNRMDQLGAKIVALYPDPNQPGTVDSSGRTIENYSAARPDHENTHKFDVRNDYYFTQSDQFSFRYSFLQQNIFRSAIFPGNIADCGSQDCNTGKQYNRNQSLGASWTRTLSPRIVNVLRFGYYRTYATFAHTSADGPTATAFGFKGIPSNLPQTGGLPRIEITDYQELGTRNFRPQYQKPHLYGILDNVSLSEGAHTIRVGFEVRTKSDEFIDIQRRTPDYRFRGNFTNDPLADLFLGLPDQFTIMSVPIINQLQQAWAGYVQDDWKVNPRLTLNIGLRYEYATPYYGDSPNRNINFDFKTGQLVRANGADKYLVNPDKKDWGPRLGIAYQVLPSRMVLRAGYGIFYNGEDIFGSDTNLPLNPPQLVSVTLSEQGTTPPMRLSDPIPNNILTQYNTSTLALRARDRDWRSPQVQQFNVATQIQLPAESSFEIAYVGNRGRHLIANFDANQTAFGADPSVQANYPYPNFFQIYTGTTRGTSHYNALELKYDKPFKRGLYVLSSYTYASAIDEAGAWGSDNQPQVRDCFVCERGPMAQVPRHRFTLAAVYELPVGRGRTFGNNLNRVVEGFIGGWQLSSIVSWRSGLPLDVSLDPAGTDPITGQAINFNNIPNDFGDLRPNRIGNPNTGISPSDDRFHFLNVNAFQLQPLNTPGNSERNVAHGPRFGTLDLSLVKRFTLTERMNLDFRAEAFNFLNHTNYKDPSQTTWGDDGFGVIDDAFDPRVIQLAVRLRF
jgi:hypothetical protein